MVRNEAFGPILNLSLLIDCFRSQHPVRLEFFCETSL